MRTLFIGGTRRGYDCLKALLDLNADIVGIFSLRQHPHESERYEEAFRTLASEADIPLWESDRLQERDYAALLRDELRPELNVVVGCRILLPETIYDYPARGTIALHDSLLPEYRGFAPLNWSIINGERETGVTLFYLNELMDGGDIVAQTAVPIGQDDTAPQVYEKVCQASVDLLVKQYPLLADGTADRVPQSYDTGTFTSSRTPSDGLLDWTRSTADLYNLVRGLTHPYPGAFTYYRDQKLIVWTARPLESPPTYKGRIPGRIVRIVPGEGVYVLTGDGILVVKEVQLPDGPRVPAEEVLTSVRASVGIDVVSVMKRLNALQAKLALKEDTAE